MLNKFTQKLFETLSDKSYTQKELADVLGHSRQTINRWINGVNEPDLDTLLRICIFLKKDPNTMLGFNDLTDEELGQYDEMNRFYHEDEEKILHDRIEWRLKDLQNMEKEYNKIIRKNKKTTKDINFINDYKIRQLQYAEEIYRMNKDIYPPVSYRDDNRITELEKLKADAKNEEAKINIQYSIYDEMKKPRKPEKKDEN